MDSRWHLILGVDEEMEEMQLSSDEKQIEDLLKSVYGQEKKGGFGKSSHKVRKWLDGIRTHFTSEVVSLIQKDALERQNVKEMLLEPELLEKIEPDVQLVSTILSLQHLLPDVTRNVARSLVERLVKTIEEKLKTKLKSAVKNGLNVQSKKVDPQSSRIDWKKTIQKNLKNYKPEIKTIIPESWYGYKSGYKLKEVILLIDKSESMIDSAIHASIIGSVLASLRSLKTHLIFFDTEISDLTDKYQDPVDILFSVPMGGGTDIGKALNYVNQNIRKHTEALIFLISDLDEGASKEDLYKALENLVSKGAHIQCLLSLNDDGKTEYNRNIAEIFSSYNIPVYSCTTEKFPEILSFELSKI